MHVRDLLRLDSLDLELLWAEEPLLDTEFDGITVTDLEDPSRFLHPGEIVLTGLVWWSPDDGRARAERFVAALHAAGTSALLAGEETHGSIPSVLVDACRDHGIAVLAVPAHVNFRTITDAVYLREWGGFRRPAARHALPENVREELGHLLDVGSDADTLLRRALAHLGMPACHLLSASGRVLASTPGAPPPPADRAAELPRRSTGITLRVAGETSPYDVWHLHLPEPDAAPPHALHETAEVLGRHRGALAARTAEARRTAAELVALVEESAADGPALRAALRACGLPQDGPYRVLDAAADPDAAGRHGAADALAEALRGLPGAAGAGPAYAVAPRPDGSAVAVVHTAGGEPPTVQASAPGNGTPAGSAVAEETDAGDGWGEAEEQALRRAWQALHARAPEGALHAGVSGPAATAKDLDGALVQARYARAAATADAPGAARVTSCGQLATLAALLDGVPAEVRAVFSRRALGPLAAADSPGHRVLLRTLEVFLDRNCSWARTSEALHVHVNTVHYRVRRIEQLTGRDLSRLDHKLDLRAALLCRPGR